MIPSIKTLADDIREAAERYAAGAWQRENVHDDGEDKATLDEAIDALAAEAQRLHDKLIEHWSETVTDVPLC